MNSFSVDMQQVLGKIPEPMRPTVEGYADLVQSLFGQHALSLTFYGLLAETDRQAEWNAGSDLTQNLIVLDRVDLSALRSLSEHGMRLSHERIAAPIIMTPPYIKESCDTFALEFIEIAQGRIVLFGPDYFQDLEFQPEHVRLQIERELKVILIRLRQSLLASLNEEQAFAAITKDAGRAILRILRGFLWLKGEEQRQPLDAQLTNVEEKTGRHLTGLRHALDPKRSHGWDAFQALYDDVESLGAVADAW